MVRVLEGKGWGLVVSGHSYAEIVKYGKNLRRESFDVAISEEVASAGIVINEVGALGM